MVRHTPSSLLALLLLPAVPAAAQIDGVFAGVRVPLVSPVGAPDTDYIVADVDLDGVPDLLGASYDMGPLLQVARGRATGGFSPVENWPLVGAVEFCLAVGDLNGDGWPDVALGDSKQRVVTAPGTGGGSFGFSAQYYVGNGKPVQVAIVDLNHDGIGDLLSATDSSPGWLNVNLADGTGGYLATHAFTPGTKISDMEIADLNGDGWTDAVTCDSSADKLAVMLGDGAGGFLPAKLYTTSDNPRDVIVGPLDGDADLDVLLDCSGASSGGTGVVSSWLGDGTGALVAGSSTPVPHFPSAGTLYDLDGDGDLDVVVGTPGNETASVLHNDGSAGFTPGQTVFLGKAATSANVLDVTGDGVPDLLVHSLQEYAAVFPGKPDGTFPDIDVWISSDGQNNAFDVGRIDGDDIPDVVFASYGSSALGTLLGRSGGLSTTPLFSPGFLPSNDVAVGDVDGDDLADAIMAASLPPRLQVGHGLGNGTFAPPKFVTWAGGTSTPSWLRLTGLDGDGWRDVLGLVNGSASELLVFRNLGGHQGQFAAPATLDAGSFTFYLSVGDLDGDGDPDVVLLDLMTYSVKDGQLRVLLGDGTGALLPGPLTPLITPQYEAQGLAQADFDLDGQLDVAVGEYYGSVTVALGDGAGGFHVGAWSAPADWGTRTLAADDVDGDGLSDLVQGGSNSGSALVLRRGDGAGGLLPPQTYASSDGVQRIALADFTQDGQPDLVAAGYTQLTGFDGQIEFIPNVATPFVWTSLGSGLAGALGEPHLNGTGALLAGTPGFVRLTSAAPSAPAALFVAADANPTPFKGGVLVPVPPGVLKFLATDAKGVATVSWSSWPSSQPGADWFFQFGVMDAGAPHGVALSNAVSGTEPD